MSESQTDTKREKLRAFEKKMQDEGAAGFANGPSPWETWDDESGLTAKKRIWEGKSKRIYPKDRPQQSLGDRVLSGLAMLSLATMVVGIAGVYFSDPQPLEVAATGIQPQPVERTPPDTDSIVSSLEQLPRPTAGNVASRIDRSDFTPLAAVTRTSPDTVIMAVEAPAGDSTVQAPAHPATTTAAGPVADVENSVGNPATQPVALTEPATTTTGTANLAGINAAADSVSAIPTLIAKGDTGSAPAPVASGISIEPPMSPATVTAAPVTVTVTVRTGTADHVTTDTLATTAADTAVAPVNEATMTTPQAIAGIPNPIPDTAAASSHRQSLPASFADPAEAPEPDSVAETGIAAAVVTPVELITTDISRTETAADTVAILEALPVPTAGPAVIAEAAPANSSSIPLPTTTNTVVAAAEPAPRTAAIAPTEAAKQTAAAVKSGDWVVNLASYTRKSTANRMLDKFRGKGVNAELVTVTINEKPMHRIRVTGFASSRTAKASIGSLEQQLGLEGVWISRK